jgi:uncharacterized damage-inducible protein DinB
MPPAVKTEREGLLAFLVQQRAGLTNAAYGLTEEQIRMRPTRSELTVGGLLKHAAGTERGWIATMLARPEEADEQGYVDTFALTESDTLAGLVADLERVADEMDSAVNGLEDLGVTVQLPSAPWFPSNPEGFSARWILLHVIEELARHAGHADIIREHIDGATTYELLAAVEGWPKSDWITPWQPAQAPQEAESTG